MPENNQQLSLIVAEASRKDVGRGIARISPAIFDRLGVEIGDTIKIIGTNYSVVRVMPSFKDKRKEDMIQIDGIIRKNVNTSLGHKVTIEKILVKPAIRVILFSQMAKNSRRLSDFSELFQNLPVTEGDMVRTAYFGSSFNVFRVKKVVPSSPGIITLETQFSFETEQAAPSKKQSVSSGTQYSITYEDIGGLDRQIQKIREMIELPLKYPEIFLRLGIEPPKGVLLYGPPGTGKTLIARAVANETDAYFISINGPEIINKFYGESEAQLRKVFQQAESNAPSIIFLDEIDAIAQKRSETKGDVEKRVVAQLLGLMDGLIKRGHVIVIGATNMVDSLDPALRRPGRFDREISIDAPGKKGRQEILNIHTRGTNLDSDVDLVKLSEITQGFVGADLEALVREAAMNALRRVLPHLDFTVNDDIYTKLLNLSVGFKDFIDALPEIQPSALKEVFVEIPDITWSDVGGLEEVKDALIETIEWPLKYEELFKKAGARPPRGILLYGQPGTGKTLLAKACASESNANFILVKGPSLFSKWVGESEKAVREIFKKAKQAAPCIIFFDEIEAIAPIRKGSEFDSGVQERTISQLLNEIDGIEELQGVLVMGATNRRELLDPAILRPGRFDLQFELKAPDNEARREIFIIYTRNKPLEKEVNVNRLVELSEGFTGADIESICQTATMLAIRRFINEKQPDRLDDFTISMKDFLTALEKRSQIKG